MLDGVHEDIGLHACRQVEGTENTHRQWQLIGSVNFQAGSTPRQAWKGAPSVQGSNLNSLSYDA
eukprot:1138162-Pelagomonas_calceolata.AAC.2